MKSNIFFTILFLMITFILVRVEQINHKLNKIDSIDLKWYMKTLFYRQLDIDEQIKKIQDDIFSIKYDVKWKVTWKKSWEASRR